MNNMDPILFLALFCIILLSCYTGMYVWYHMRIGIPFKEAVKLFINQFKFW